MGSTGLIKLEADMKKYFRNLWITICNKDRKSSLSNCKPNTWYRVVGIDGKILYGHIKTDEAGRFIPPVCVSNPFMSHDPQ